MMVVTVPPKAGRLATGAYSEDSPIAGQPFPQGDLPVQLPAVVGGLKMKDDRTATVYGNPLFGSYNSATQKEVGPSTSHAGQIYSPDNVPEIGPQERGKFFVTKAIIPLEKTQFGAAGDKRADTAFQRKPFITNAPPQPRSARAGERTSALSFSSLNNLWQDANNSYLYGVTSAATTKTGTGRWGTVKKGAGG